MAKLADARDLKSRDTRVSYRFDPGFRHHYIAEWSSPVARRAHNPKVMWFKSHLRNHIVKPKKISWLRTPRNLTISGVFLAFPRFFATMRFADIECKKKISFQKNGFGQDVNPVVPVF